MPDDALLAQPVGRAIWSQTHELLAALVEVASIGASVKNRLKKPIEVPRPKVQARRRRGSGRVAVNAAREYAAGAVSVADAVAMHAAAGGIVRTAARRG